MKIKHTHLMATVSIFALGASPVLAQDVFDLGEVTVFANQAPTAVDRTGVTVEILDTQDIQDTGAEKLSDALNTLPGVSVNSTGGLGKSTDVRIRGLPGRYVSVRINGIDVTDPSSVQTQFNWGGLTTAGITNVEVLKGSQSALYGSEAIGGAINITTARPDKIGTTYSFGVEVGSYNTVRGDLSIATKTERGDLSFSLSQVDTDGFSARDENDGNTEEDGFNGVTALLSAGYELTDTVRLGFDYIYMNEETDIDGFSGDADRPFFTDRRGIRTYAEIDSGLVQHTLEASYFKTERFDPESGSATTRFEGERTEFRYQGLADLADVQLAFGAEYSEETATLSNGDFDYDVYSIFGEAQYAVNADLDVSAALRVDHHSEFGTEPTGRLALAWRPMAGTVVRASLANGFRAPSLNELFGPFNFSAPNPDLDPERSRSAEIGIEHNYASGAQVVATAFYTEIDDLIAYPVDNYVQIDGTTRTRGVELSGRLPISERLTVFANYTYTNAEDPDGDQLTRVPENDYRIGVKALLTDRLTGSFSVNVVTDRLDGFSPATPEDDYTLVNASLNYAINDNISMYLRVENLTDEEYQTVRGFGTSDRAAYIGLRASF
ncbi:MAG: TonB-dependent receptor plug domain-containing protein [Roseobacter sp.]